MAEVISAVSSFAESDKFDSRDFAVSAERQTGEQFFTRSEASESSDSISPQLPSLSSLSTSHSSWADMADEDEFAEPTETAQQASEPAHNVVQQDQQQTRNDTQQTIQSTTVEVVCTVNTPTTLAIDVQTSLSANPKITFGPFHPPTAQKYFKPLLINIPLTNARYVAAYFRASALLDDAYGSRLFEMLLAIWFDSCWAEALKTGNVKNCYYAVLVHAPMKMLNTIQQCIRQARDDYDCTLPLDDGSKLCHVQFLNVAYVVTHDGKRRQFRSGSMHVAQ